MTNHLGGKKKICSINMNEVIEIQVGFFKKEAREVSITIFK